MTVPAPVWCLPRERFLMFTFCVGWKRINPALYPALKAMGEAERVEDERRSREYAERVRAYEETRQQAIRLLMNCDQLNHLLETLDREMATVLTVVEGTDLMALCARGRTVIRTAAEAARKALRQLRTGGITEYTSYDPQVDAMRTRIIPNHPTLPNPATMVALDEGESAFLTWVAPFLLYLQRHFADTDGA